MSLPAPVICDHAAKLERSIAGVFARPHAARALPECVSLPRERKKLWDLAPALHCSVVGTCFSTVELRSIVGKLLNTNVSSLTDLEIHEQGVSMASCRESGKVLQKALDRRYQSTIDRFDRLRDSAALRDLWEVSKVGGDIPGAYWAVLTHRDAPAELAQLVFGDVHMLSHLVGAANRADIRKLSRLAEGHAALESKVELLEARLREDIALRDEEIRRLKTLASRPSARCAVSTPRESDRDDGAPALRDQIAQLERRLGVEIGRREAAEKRRSAAEEALAHATAHARSLGERERDLLAELAMLESGLSGDIAQTADRSRTPLANTTVLYVGGRTAQIQRLRECVERFGGEFLHHDGGVEERRGLLAGAVNRADVVFFPVDCISHDAALALKRLCLQMEKPFLPLRSAGVASFAVALERYLQEPAVACAH